MDVSAGVTLTAEAGGGFTIVATVFPTAARKMQPQVRQPGSLRSNIKFRGFC